MPLLVPSITSSSAFVLTDPLVSADLICNIPRSAALPGSVLKKVVFGGETEDWGLDWSDWTDVSDLAFKITQSPVDAVGNTLCWVHEIDATIYYTEEVAGVTHNATFFGTNF